MANRAVQHNKRSLKQVLGELPLAAEMYWQLRQGGGPPLKSFSLHRIQKWLPTIRAQAEAAVHQDIHGREHPSKRIVIFTTLRYWIEHAVVMGLALAGQGHQVTLLYLPFPQWKRPYSLFDQRRLNAYARKTLAGAGPLLHTISLLDLPQAAQEQLPPALVKMIEEVSLRDAQYTLQVEQVETDGDLPSADLYYLRLERNLLAARAFTHWVQSLQQQRPEVLLTPNGSILEMGAIYQAANHLGIPTVTYEFGEQRGRIWLAQQSEVMLQETGALWAAWKDTPLSEAQWQQIRALYASRQNASLWENFARLWQGQPSQGGAQVRQALGLDQRPVAVLPANVIGDSLTLGRQVFSENMTEWLQRTVQSFVNKEQVQLVVRIHPGERYTTGPSVAEVVRNVLPELPPHIHLVQAGDPINTYDLIEIADLGLVYTTTVGMEMCMSGVPVIAAGKTHYRGKGFTLDPGTWDQYFHMVEQFLDDPQAHRLSRPQVEQAWHYAYRFFFDYPCPFPWHLLDYWKELETWPMSRVLSAEGQALYGSTFQYLIGEPRKAEPMAEQEIPLGAESPEDPFEAA
ncbi:MAG: hypothetical protein AB1894_16550 [Chloroflexota bacterium]